MTVVLRERIKDLSPMVIVLLILCDVLLFAPAAGAQAPDDPDNIPASPTSLDGESAWDALARLQPELLSDRTVTPLERKILQVLSPDQADAYLSGADPESIILPGGENLGDFIARIERQEAVGLVYKPIVPCLVADSRRSQGKLTADETRALVIRGPEADYSSQGGGATDCGLPGLRGEDLQSNTIRALVLNVEVLDAEGTGEFRMWAANDHPRPSVPLFRYGPEGPQANNYHPLIVSVCDEESPAPCSTGDLMMQTGDAGAHVVISALGYFQTAEAGDGVADLWFQSGNDIYNTNSGRVGIGTSNPGGNLHTRGVSTLELLLQAASGNPDFSMAQAGNVKAQVKYLIAEDGLGFLADENHIGLGGLASSKTKVFVSGTSDNVGVGTTTPSSRLTVAGTVESTTGGFRFPDGSVQTSAGGVGPNSVGSAEVIDNSLTSSDLGSSSVGSSELQSNAVSSSKVLDNSLTSSDLASGSVGSSEVLDNSLTSLDLGSSSVGSSELQSNAVSSSKVLDNSLTSSDLGSSSVGSSELQSNSVSSSKVLDNSLTSSDLASSSVGSSEIANGSISYFDIGWPIAGTVESRGLEVQNSSGSTRAETFVSSDVGILATYGSNGNLNARFNYVTGFSNNGHIGVYNSSGSRRAGMAVNGGGPGNIFTEGDNGNSNTSLTYLSGYLNNGYVAAHDSNGSIRAGLYVTSSDVGRVFTQGPNGSLNARLSFLGGYPNNGFVAAYDSSGNSQAGMYVDSSGNGIVFGDTKSFRVPNPDDPETDIWYASLEGPEAAAYVRGTARLVGGRAVIDLPTHFRAVASPGGLTVTVTPLAAESKGLAVVDKSLDGIEVRELAGGDGSYDFDYMIMAVRRGHEDFRVIRPVGEAQPAGGAREAAPIDGGS